MTTIYGTRFLRTLAAALEAAGWEPLGFDRFRHPATALEAHAAGQSVALRQPDGRTVCIVRSRKVEERNRALDCESQLVARVREIESSRQVAAPQD